MALLIQQRISLEIPACKYMWVCLELSPSPMTLGFSRWLFKLDWGMEKDNISINWVHMKDVFLYQVMPQWRFQQYIFTYAALKKASAPRTSVRAVIIWHSKPKERIQNISLDWILQICYSQNYLLLCYSIALFVLQGLWPFLSVKVVEH